MEIEVVRLDEFEGKCGYVYSVSLDGDDTLYDDFLKRYSTLYPDEIKDILTRLKQMSLYTGFVDTFFKMNEGSPGDGVCALFDKRKILRLYCIRYGNIALIVGCGGPKNTRTYQDDPYLNDKVEIIKKVSSVITKSIKEKLINLNINGEFSGQLIIDEDEAEK